MYINFTIDDMLALLETHAVYITSKTSLTIKGRTISLAESSVIVNNLRPSSILSAITKISNELVDIQLDVDYVNICNVLGIIDSWTKLTPLTGDAYGINHVPELTGVNWNPGTPFAIYQRRKFLNETTTALMINPSSKLLVRVNETTNLLELPSHLPAPGKGMLESLRDYLTLTRKGCTDNLKLLSINTCKTEGTEVTNYSFICDTNKPAPVSHMFVHPKDLMLEPHMLSQDLQLMLKHPTFA